MTSNNKPLESLPVSGKTRKMWILLSVLGTVLFGVQLATGGPGASSTLMVVGLLMAVWSHRAEVVKVYDRHLEVKVGPLAGSTRVLFDEIQELEESKRVAKITYLKKGKRKSLKLPIALLETADKDWLLGEIEGALAA